LATTNGGTGLTSFTSGGVVYASSTSALATGSALAYNGIQFTNSQNTNQGVYIVNRNVSTGTAATAYITSDVTAAFSAYTSMGSRSSGYTTSGMLEASSGGVFTVGMTNGLNIMTLDGYPVKFGVNNAEGMRLTSTGLGIGTTSPATKLDVSATSGINAIRVNNTSTDTSSFAAQAYFRVDAGGNHIGGLKATVRNLTNLSTPSLFLTTAGPYPIAFGLNDSSSPNMLLTTSGGLSINTASDPGVGAIYATGAITAFFSDQRLKTVSGKIENALDKVAKLSGVYYTFNDTAKSFGYDSDEEQVGVIAQEVEAVLPQIVKAAPFDLDEYNNSKSGENYKTVQYEKLVPLLIEAINELRAEVTALKGTI
jgi:hypothetical protein